LLIVDRPEKVKHDRKKRHRRLAWDSSTKNEWNMSDAELAEINKTGPREGGVNGELKTNNRATRTEKEGMLGRRKLQMQRHQELEEEERALEAGGQQADTQQARAVFL
jgi:hypothetical protein